LDQEKPSGGWAGPDMCFRGPVGAGLPGVQSGPEPAGDGATETLEGQAFQACGWYKSLGRVGSRRPFCTPSHTRSPEPVLSRRLPRLAEGPGPTLAPSPGYS